LTGFFLLAAAVMALWETTRLAALLPLALGVIPGSVTLARYVALRTSQFVVTNKRVMIKMGLLHLRSLEILLTKIESIGVDQTFMGRLLNYGSLTIGGTGGTKEVFHQIHSPITFRLHVQEQTAQ
jgi:uncharacterized membrane protein YdbT with pleckstrin-like domain